MDAYSCRDIKVCGSKEKLYELPPGPKVIGFRVLSLFLVAHEILVLIDVSL